MSTTRKVNEVYRMVTWIALITFKYLICFYETSTVSIASFWMRDSWTTILPPVTRYSLLTLCSSMFTSSHTNISSNPFISSYHFWLSFFRFNQKREWSFGQLDNLSSFSLFKTSLEILLPYHHFKWNVQIAVDCLAAAAITVSIHLFTNFALEFQADAVSLLVNDSLNLCITHFRDCNAMLLSRLTVVRNGNCTHYCSIVDRIKSNISIKSFL